MDLLQVNRKHYDNITWIMSNMIPQPIIYVKPADVKTTDLQYNLVPYITLHPYLRDSYDKIIVIHTLFKTQIYIRPNGFYSKAQSQLIRTILTKYKCFMYKSGQQLICLPDEVQECLSHALQHLFDSVDTGLTKRAK
tara:strand:- start:19019 stop:19429 length:411 start_codon:yes stop_codon:yes gene_type:complete